MFSCRVCAQSAAYSSCREKWGSARHITEEDVLDSVVSLRLPPDYDANQGARFEVYFTKHRGFFGPDAQPFEAKLIEGRWHTCDIQRGSDEETMRALQKQGLSFRDIAERLGVSKSSVGRKLNGGEA